MVWLSAYMVDDRNAVLVVALGNAFNKKTLGICNILTGASWAPYTYLGNTCVEHK